MNAQLPQGTVPVIAIDGPTASGKGTVAARVADVLGWTVLDSGALYRLSALSALKKGVADTDENALADIARQLDIRFQDGKVLLDNDDVTEQLRQEHIGEMASRIAPLPPLRDALLERQRAFRQAPGLVCDGRDMGTVVFPDASLKIFLVADVDARAQRRYNQLIEKGFSANLGDLLKDLKTRDDRDQNRSVAPLKPAADAIIVDSSGLDISQTVDRILTHWRNLG
ncbi:cytidylate kinase [Advenella kashmirensis W13003]|uniref:Cytidylate kinase n=1 Tax=Advenella kashmirensis W13003 TaxID=1424334 RepID=V8QP84_9BURK|nr:(d)CMP kinase [Advenella kashmirensis]ETF01781.1 cytidylate kinase [Advenella kashmirensis W13003]